MRDEWGAFVPAAGPRVPGATTGPLAGLTFAAKDLFDVEGYVTGCGNPDWRRTHQPAEGTAQAIRVLLDAGASLAGKTITDELAYSLTGQNDHYGTPVNPASPKRIPGGSSSGSASAVAGSLVDFALGTDTGGSIRVPAALCGIFGFRPTHGAISLDGVMPLAPTFDTVGWLAREPSLLARVGDVLLPPAGPGRSLETLLVADDAFAVADETVRELLEDGVVSLTAAFDSSRGVKVAEAVPGGPRDLSCWMDCFRVIQGREIWRVHADWIESTRPRFGAGVAARFSWASTVTDSEASEAAGLRERFRTALGGLLDGAVLCLPTAPGIAPRLDAGEEELNRFRGRALTLTCIGGLAGLPQVALPIGRARGAVGTGDGPAGLSLIAGRGADRRLLDLAARFCSEGVFGQNDRRSCGR
jgi:amidase